MQNPRTSLTRTSSTRSSSSRTCAKRPAAIIDTVKNTQHSKKQKTHRLDSIDDVLRSLAHEAINELSQQAPSPSGVHTAIANHVCIDSDIPEAPLSFFKRAGLSLSVSHHPPPRSLQTPPPPFRPRLDDSFVQPFLSSSPVPQPCSPPSQPARRRIDASQATLTPTTAGAAQTLLNLRR